MKSHPVVLARACMSLALVSSFGSVALATDQTVDGSLSVTGDTDLGGNTLSFGTRADFGTIPGLNLLYSDATAPTIYFNATRPTANWLWQSNTSTPQMKLDTTNTLSLPNSTTGAAGIVLNPNGLSVFSGTLMIGGASVLTSTSDGSGLTSLNASQLSTGTVSADRGGAGAVSGLLKADGDGVVSPAVAGIDFLSPTGSGADLTNIVKGWGDLIGTAVDDNGVLAALDFKEWGTEMYTSLNSYLGGLVISRYNATNFTRGNAVLLPYLGDDVLFYFPQAESNSFEYTFLVSNNTTGASTIPGDLAVNGKITNGGGQLAEVGVLIDDNLTVTGHALIASGMTVKGIIRVPESGDLSMGGFHEGANPADE